MGGGELAELTPETMEAYNAVLPTTWSHNNPVDIIGDASPERYAKALEVAARDPRSDGILVILTPQAMTDPIRIAEQLRPLAKQEGKPVIASWMGGVDVAAALRRMGDWVFMSDVCKHCTNAGCLDACPTGALIRTERVTVL